MSRPAEHAAPRRILIVRLSALGDVVLSSGLIPALRSLWPDARLSWLVEAPAAPLVAHNPRLDEVIVLPRAQWIALWRGGERLKALREIIAFRRRLRGYRFDLVVDPQGLLKSGLLAWFSGAPRRVNLLPRERSDWLMSESVRPDGRDDPVVSHEYRALARYLGAAPEAFQLDLAIGAAPREAARRGLAQAGVEGGPGGRPYAILAAFTTRPQKHWVESSWTALAGQLAARGYTPVLLGGPGDTAAAARIAAGEPSLVNLAGRLKLDESAAAISESALLVGVDTALTHMGIALRVPTVALFGSTTPYLHGTDARTRVLHDHLPCSPCNRRPTCDGRYDCMRQLDVPRVLEAARQVVDAVPTVPIALAVPAPTTPRPACP